MNAASHVRKWVACILVLLAGTAAPAGGQQSPTLRVICLPNRPLAIVVAQQQGLFAKHRVDVQVEVAPNSNALRDDLAAGKFDVAHAAVDNAVSMVEDNRSDIVIVMGGEGSTNELIAQPGIQSVPDLRGRTLIVDATNTAYALQLKKILSMNGLQSGGDYDIKAVGATPQRLAAMRKNKEYAASMLGPPSSLIAKRDGFVSLATTQNTIGAYQGIGAFVRGAWARDNRSLLTRYIEAYVEAQRWILDPANKQQVIQSLSEELKLPQSIADETYAVEIMGRGGYEPDAYFDMQGFREVLKLRTEVERQSAGKPSPPEKYCNFSFYRSALSELKKRQ